MALRTALMTRRIARAIASPRARRTVAVGGVLLMAFTVLSARAEVTIEASRTVTPNGRTVQEVRLGSTPGDPDSLRVIAVTNGPTAGTTTLTTAVAPLGAWFDPGPPPLFVNVNGTLGTTFSIGTGCLRGNQLDFPFIDGNRPKILRFIGNGAGTVIPLPILDANAYDSADCVVSPDGLATYFIYSDRTNARLPIYRDTGGPNDLAGHLVAFSSVKTPFVGGLRPSISLLPQSEAVSPGNPHLLSLVFMETSGQTRWRQYDITNFNVDFNCLAGTQAPPPTGFTVPRGSTVSGNVALGDFNGDGIAEVTVIDKSTPTACANPPPTTPFGSTVGAQYNWTEFASMRFNNGTRAFLGNQVASAAPLTVETGPFGTPGGPNAICDIRSSEYSAQMAFAVTAKAVGATIQINQSYWKYLAALNESRDRIQSSSLEKPMTRSELMCMIVENFLR